MARVSASISKAVQEALAQGYQISPEALKTLQDIEQHGKNVDFSLLVRRVIEDKSRPGSTIGGTTVDVADMRETFPDLFDTVMDPVNENDAGSVASSEVASDVEIVKDPSGDLKPTGMEGFAQLFKSRYDKVVKILHERPEGRQLTKISKVGTEKGTVRIAGLVFSRRQTKNGIEFSLDDDTGSTNVLALSPEAKKAASDISLDQCVMVEAESVQGRLILKNVVQPDIPNKASSTSKKTVYAVFLSDLHIGSDKFLEGAFDRFLEWLAGRGRISETDSEIIRRLKYVVIGGDVVDGVGVFPNQEYELKERNIYKQYDMVAEKLKMVPEHLQMFIIPGNHDATRQALPQPMIPEKYAGALYGLKNVKMLGDPCFFKLNGVSILTYHGRSLDDVLATTPGLSYEKPADAMRMLLKARHLAPMFGSRTPIAPEVEDHLVIEQVPDIFHAGHVHTVGIESYKSTLIINSGTWQAQTGYQSNLGISPRPGLVPIVNLATLEVVLREFLTSTSIAS
ncbi:MAG: DNA-directed DNA polymerase II small subunit [Nitrososphaerota archaeon]|nr:DNA-directed DNA polymerase II small subunit [Nitrososphaerota archaeon]